MRLDAPTRDGVAGLHDNCLQPTTGQLQPQASELRERAPYGSELATAWSAFASLARGLTSRPWAEVERAFINAGSREAAETREVAARVDGGGKQSGRPAARYRSERIGETARSSGDVRCNHIGLAAVVRVYKRVGGWVLPRSC